MAKTGEIEGRVREIAAAIYPHLQEETPSFFAAEGWRGKVVEWTMRDEQFRTQFLRFLDTLPSLRSDDLVLRLFREYLKEAPGSGSLLLESADVFSRTVPAVVAAPLIRSAVRSLARQFVAGADPADADGALERLRKEEALISLDLLGEAVVSEAEASSMQSGTWTF